MKSGDVAILPRSRSIFERKATINPRDSIVTDGFAPSPFLETPSYRDFFYAGNEQIVPDGPDNLFPYNWKRMIESDSIMPGMLRQRIDLMMAGRHMLFLEKVIENNGRKSIVLDPIIDNEISDWLDSFGFANYVIEQATDFVYIERVATMMIPNRFSRLGRDFDNNKKISSLKRIPIEDVRMGLMEPGTYDVKKYFISDWMNWTDGVTTVPAYDKNNPFGNPQSLFYEKMPSFSSKYYGRPSTIGVANYLNLKLLILNNTQDFIVNAPFRYHIESPYEYWKAIQEDNNWNLKQLEDYENEFFSRVDDFLSASDGRNAVKRFHTKFKLDEYGKSAASWKITAIEDDTPNRIKANFEAFGKINENIIAATSLDPSLSNIQITGKLSSGLDKLIAFNMHQLTNTPIPRRKILAAVNEAIRLNFWRNDYRPVLAFEQLQLDTQTKATSGGNNDSN
jgi:hypothetical protein